MELISLIDFAICITEQEINFVPPLLSKLAMQLPLHFDDDAM